MKKILIYGLITLVLAGCQGTAKTTNTASTPTETKTTGKSSDRDIKEKKLDMPDFIEEDNVYHSDFVLSNKGVTIRATFYAREEEETGNDLLIYQVMTTEIDMEEAGLTKEEVEEKSRTTQAQYQGISSINVMSELTKKELTETVQIDYTGEDFKEVLKLMNPTVTEEQLESIKGLPVDAMEENLLNAGFQEVFDED